LPGRPRHGLFRKKERPTVFATCGCSYRFNAGLEGDYTGVAEDPDHNLALKKENWVSNPARFIIVHEAGPFPVVEGDNTVQVAPWHDAFNPGKMYDAKSLPRSPDRLIAPTLFVDGHAQRCDFTANFLKNPRRALEPGRDWMWYKPLP
jgi:hypothetical protein